MLDYGFYNMDCMEGMKQFPDKYFDLAIVDPPYGDAGGGTHLTNGRRKGQEPPIWTREKVRTEVRQVQTPFSDSTSQNPAGVHEIEKGAHFHTLGNRGLSTKYAKQVTRTGVTWAAVYAKKIISWDVAPTEDYFKELFRVSKHQIIWGGNYFTLPPTRCFVVWRKLSISESFSMAMAEYAWTSFNENAKVYEHTPQGDKNDKRFHPTQKPVDLYLWLLDKYAKSGDTILDTHVGSASSLIACHRTNHKYVGFEIDEDYYKKAKERLDNEEAQHNIFEYMNQPEGEE